MYFRIKILTEEGRKYADIEIPYLRQQGNVADLHARTIKPDGTIVHFGGKAFDKSIVKARGVKYMAKTFTLPDVQIGCILEYYYTTDSQRILYLQLALDSQRRAVHRERQFSLNPYTSDYRPIRVRWTWNHCRREPLNRRKRPIMLST